MSIYIVGIEYTRYTKLQLFISDCLHHDANALIRSALNRTVDCRSECSTIRYDTIQYIQVKDGIVAEN